MVGRLGDGARRSRLFFFFRGFAAAVVSRIAIVRTLCCDGDSEEKAVSMFRFQFTAAGISATIKFEERAACDEIFSKMRETVSKERQNSTL